MRVNQIGINAYAKMNSKELVDSFFRLIMKRHANKLTDQEFDVQYSLLKELDIKHLVLKG